MNILLIGNYAPDRQQSMLRFALMMEAGLRAAGHQVYISSPGAHFGPPTASAGAAKWLGYLDKYVVFPPKLKRDATTADIVHICDHSNAVYSPVLKGKPHIVTCHDLLAVRGALGEDTMCPASPAGKLLQQQVLKGLSSCDRIVCDSAATGADAARLLKHDVASLEVIPLAVDECFRRLADDEIDRRIAAANLPFLLEQPFVLAVGSNEPRKNRRGIISMFARLKDRFTGNLVMIGPPLDADCRQLVAASGLDARVFQLSADNQLLAAIYNRALALLAPSFHEGFGWPLLEAQSCGCPVVASQCAPFRELVADSALLHNVEREQDFADSLALLLDKRVRQNWVERGLSNVQQFTRESMINRYLAVYNQVLVRHQETSHLLHSEH